jgi:hypothetical protein
MSTIQQLIDTAEGPHSALAAPLTRWQIEGKTPAALARSADPRTSPTYTFLSSDGVIQAMQVAGFVPVSAAQTRTRKANPLSARHVIRFRRRYESVTLRDCIPEILFLNGHDGRTATQFRLALFRPVCTNGLIVCDDTLPFWRVPHRGNTLDEVIAAAIQQSEQFAQVGQWVERMERTVLDVEQRMTFAAAALVLRFSKNRSPGLRPEHLLQPRREEDTRHDLWTVYNVVQEWVIKGGLSYQTTNKRQMHSRGIRAIREDVRLNTELWRMATALAA